MSGEVFGGRKASVESAVSTTWCLLCLLSSHGKIAEQDWIGMLLALFSLEEWLGWYPSILRGINSRYGLRPELGKTVLFPDQWVRLVRLWRNSVPVLRIGETSTRLDREVGMEDRGQCLQFGAGSLNPSDKGLSWQLAGSCTSRTWQYISGSVDPFPQIKTKMQLNFMSFIHPFPLCRH